MKDDNTSLPLTDEFCIFGGTWAAPVMPNMWLKTNQAEDLFTGAPFSALSRAWGMNLFLHGMGGTCFCRLVMLWRCLYFSDFREKFKFYSTVEMM